MLHDCFAITHEDLQARVKPNVVHEQLMPKQVILGTISNETQGGTKARPSYFSLEKLK